MVPSASTEELSTPIVFQISPLIRLTLLLLYVALTLPLPFLAAFADAPIPPWLLTVGLGLGAIALYGALSERVVVDAEHIQVTYPVWVPRLFRRGWVLSWQHITGLRARTTGQGGIVYYFVSRESDKAYLLPMRVVGFARLVQIVQAQTGIDTQDVRPLAQPWMYLILLVFTFLLLAVDGWTLMNVAQLGNGIGMSGMGM